MTVVRCLNSCADVPCASANITGVWNDGRTEWILDDDVLQQHDLQDVVNCAEVGDAILLRASRTIKPKSRVTIRRSITIEGQSSQESVLTCAEGRGLFRVYGMNVTLKNMTIKKCSVVKDYGLLYIKIKQCRTGTNAIIRLENMKIRNINNDDSRRIFSVGGQDCSEFVMEDVTISATHARQSFMASKNTLRRVQLLGNVVLKGSDTTPSLFYFPSNSKTQFIDSVARHTTGSVIRVYKGTLEIVISRFEHNSHDSQNGTIKAHDSHVMISESVFESNNYTKGGCMESEYSALSIHRSNFSKNVAQFHGGCIYAGHSKTIRIEFSKFSNNVVERSRNTFECNGAAICIYRKDADATDNHVSISGCIFEMNVAKRYGRCFEVSEWSARMTIRNTAFIQNVAIKDSSTMRVWDSKGIDLKLQNCLFWNNKGLYNGGLDLSSATGKLSVQSSQFIQNNGYALGVLRAIERLTVVVTDSVFRSSSEGLRGGIEFFAGLESSMTVRNCSFRNHHGIKGAAMRIEGMKSLRVEDSELMENSGVLFGALWISNVQLVDISRCSFSRNSAKSGAAMYVETGVSADVTDCRFKHNTATERGGAVLLTGRGLYTIDKSTLMGNKAMIGGGLVVMGEVFGTLSITEVIDNEANLYGGGVAIVTKQRLKSKVPDCTFQNVKLKRNKATLGGNHHREMQAVSQLRIGGVYVAKDEERSRPVKFTETKFDKNYASKAGGAVYTDMVKMVEFNCSQPKLKMTTDHMCESMRGNRVGRGGYGQHVATSSTNFFIRLYYENGTLATVYTPKTISLSEVASGEAFPNVEVVTLDAFDHQEVLTHRTNSERETLKEGSMVGYEEYVRAAMSSKDGFMNNTLTTDVSKGKNNLTLGRPFATPGPYSLTVSLKDVVNESVTIDFNIRDCMINEKTALNGTFCQKCDGDHYNFNPQKENCTMCPENADCSKEFIIPSKGYWNALPCSPFIDRCIYEEACPRRGYFRVTIPLTNSILSALFEEHREEYSRFLCEKGYEGMLCGSCEKDWGHSGNFQCRRCQRSSVAIIAVTGQVVILLLVSLLEISATRTSIRTTYKKLTRSSPIKPRSRYSMKRIARLVNASKMHRAPSSSSSSRQTNMESSSEAKTIQLKYQEVIKIGFNFMQMVAVIVNLDVSWSASLVGLFGVWDFLGSSFTMLGSYGLDCLIPYNAALPRSVLREICVFMIPLLVLIIISIFWVTKWYWKRRGGMSTLRLFMLTVMVLFNASYISLTRSALNAFYCVPTHDWQSSDPRAVHKYWAIDTSVLCGSRSHLLLMGMVGVPGLMFSVMFPIFLVCFLIWLKNEGLLNSDWAMETMGIFLGGYKESFLHWDAFILLRKGMLSAVLAFAYNLGANLQGLLGIVILSLSLFLHMSLRPFKEQLSELNRLESCSLLITTFTMLVGAILDDEKLTITPLRWMLNVMVLVFNIGIVAYLVLLLAKFKVELIKLDLREEEVDCGDGGFFTVIKAYMQYSLEKFWENELGVWENELGVWETELVALPYI